MTQINSFSGLNTLILIDPKVSAEPDVEVIDLDGDEDFVVLGCDGLWDNLTEDDVALTIYTEIKKNPGE